MSPRKTHTMSDSHKEALAVGRAESRAIKNYLEALEATRPKRGRKRSEESTKNRLAQIEKELQASGPLKRVNLIQERMNLSASLGAESESIDIESLEADFVKVAQDYSARKGLTYAAWRELGVPASALSKAGISRSS